MRQKLRELRERYDAKARELKQIWDEAGPDRDMAKVKCIDGDSQAKVEKIRELNAELDAIMVEREPLEAEEAEYAKADRHVERLTKARNHPGHQRASDAPEEPPKVKSLGQHIIESKALSEFKGSVVEIPDVELKTLMETTAGWAPETTRTGRVVPEALRPIQVLDLIPTTTTTQAAVVYMEETTATSGAAERAEGGAYGESTLRLEERSSTVRKIATFLPVTDEQLEDEPQVRGYIDNRLTFFLRQRLDGQVLVGDGRAPNLLGITRHGSILTQALGGDAITDAPYKAMTQVRVTGRATPTAIVYHPNNWQDVRLLKTADGIYIFGSPADAGPERLWGLPVAQSDAITEHTALVGDFQMHSELAIRRGVAIEVSRSHSDYFVNGKQAIRADMRAALVIYRPEAFCLITGLDGS